MMDFMSVHQPQLQFPADHASGSSSAAHNAYGLFEGGFSAFLDTNAFNQFYSNMTLHQSHENVHQSGFVNILCSAPSFLSGTIDQGCFSQSVNINLTPFLIRISYVYNSYFEVIRALQEFPVRSFPESLLDWIETTL